MLLKQRRERPRRRRHVPFSTLYRVDAIEALALVRGHSVYGHLSVPSIGSMLLKLPLSPPRMTQLTIFQYPLSGRCY